MAKTKIKVTITSGTITLVLNKQVVSIKKQTYPKLYEEVRAIANKKNGAREIETNFDKYLKQVSQEQDVLQRTTDYTSQMKLKGTDNYIPTDILKKLQELEDVDETAMLSLLKFWYKLDKNPDPNSREQLYRFIKHNNIPITSDGDIILEKGVGKRDGMLVDKHTRTILNSIGRVVEMPRSQVNPNPQQTCSHGLHAAPPDYVRKWYSGDTIIKVLVNPADIVSVPVDYNSQKVRMCRYQVVGFSDKSKDPLTGEKVVDLQQLIDGDTQLSKTQKEKTKKAVVDKQVVKTAKMIDKNTPKFEKMTANEIVGYIQENYGVAITLSIKNKSGIVKKAYQIVADEGVVEKLTSKTSKKEKPKKEISIPATNQEIIDIVKKKFNENITRIDGKKANKQQLIDKFTELFTEAGYKIIG